MEDQFKVWDLTGKSRDLSQLFGKQQYDYWKDDLGVIRMIGKQNKMDHKILGKPYINVSAEIPGSTARYKGWAIVILTTKGEIEKEQERFTRLDWNVIPVASWRTWNAFSQRFHEWKKT